MGRHRPTSDAGRLSSGSGFLRSYGSADLQAPFDVAVVMPSVLRPLLAEALRGVFHQTFAGRVQVLIGIDHLQAERLAMLDAVCSACPDSCAVQVYYPGYSTSVRHGGLHPARDGGVLRAVLTYLANARRVAYLDDDNWWHQDHLTCLTRALDESGGAEWAFSLRWFVHPVSRWPVCIDQWESVGPGRGIFADQGGGFVDPNCLMIDKLACAAAIPCWNVPVPGDAKAMSADRMVFNVLRAQSRPAETGRPTVFYQIDPDDSLHETRLQLMAGAYEKAG